MSSIQSSSTISSETIPMIRLTRIPTTKIAAQNLLASCKTVLKSFIDSGDTFRVVHSIPEHPTLHRSSHGNELGRQADMNPAGKAQNQGPKKLGNEAKRNISDPNTLFIFDSSFNPPTLAHMALALAGFPPSEPLRENKRERHTEDHAGDDHIAHPYHQHPPPHRLLLLFSTHNADKAGTSPAAFEHRLAMMVLFALDLRQELRLRAGLGSGLTDDDASKKAEVQAEEKQDQGQHSQIDLEQENDIPIDVGLTTKPYYNDKTTAISTPPTTFSTSTSTTPHHPYPFPNHPSHFHLVGYDTYTRILTPKYYPSFTPPLSALSPYFSAGHGFIVMVREESTGDGTSGDERGKWGTVAEQAANVASLERGELEEMGGKREWGAKVQWMGDEGVGRGVSSTRVREALKMGGDRGDEGREREGLEVVKELCTEGVAGWIERWGLYGEDL